MGYEPEIIMHPAGKGFLWMLPITCDLLERLACATEHWTMFLKDATRSLSLEYYFLVSAEIIE